MVLFDGPRAVGEARAHGLSLPALSPELSGLSEFIVADPKFPKEPRWIPQARLRRSHIPAELLPWLLISSSLTRRLRRHSGGRLHLRVLDQAWVYPEPSEKQALGMRSGERALVRQVQMSGNGVPWVFARTVIPARSLCGPQRRLARLGSKPLGAVLFTDKSMRRGELELAVLVPGQHLFDLAVRDLPETPDRIWGRRSLFWLGNRPLLVCEIFLPGLLAGSRQPHSES